MTEKEYNNELEKQLFFSKEAASFLGITAQRLNMLVKTGKIKPIKKNSSGTIFHIDELNKRKEELRIFTEINQGGKDSMFKFDTKAKIEALNYSTLMNALKFTEKKMDPLFDEFSKTHRVDVYMDKDNYFDEYSEFFNISKALLKEEYKIAYKSFLSLKKSDEIIKRDSNDYPTLLSKTDEAPRFLYIRGKKSLLFEKRTVSIVGSRKANETSKENTKSLTRALGKNGITIVSGLAKGIDVTAHKEALNHGFNTIAVIGTNLNQYYPQENKEVQMEIEKKGLVVSQFSPAMKTMRWFFPLRNGVMSGLSLATIIMEAGETSGALKQADFALKQNRQVLIPNTALQINGITWPKKYVERGAETISKPSEAIEKLVSNNIFKINGNHIIQESLFESTEANSIKAESKFSQWDNVVSVKESL